MGKKKISMLSIALYVIAGILVLYTIWSVSHSVSYISELVTMGQLTVKGNEYDIVNLYMSNAQYALFAIIIFVLGWMLQGIPSPKVIRKKDKIIKDSSNGASKNKEEDDFEDWFQDNQR